MSNGATRMQARVRHQPDRSYAVLVEGPDGEVDAGSTRKTREVLTLARAEAARMLNVPEADIRADDIVLHFPQPPYGQDGQWVRILTVANPEDPSEAADVGILAQANWFSAEAAWLVTVTGTGASIHPTENLDFAPVVTDDEVAAFHTYISSASDPSSSSM